MMAPLSLIFCILPLLLAPSVSPFSVTGASGGVNTATCQRPFRYEISTFQNSGPAWDLYIQALSAMVQDNQTNQFSFYQIAGIHGRPFIPWDGVQGANQAGYCTHGSILFPSWHRPYLAAFEQIINIYAQAYATLYPAATRSTYQQAAQTLRIPYWDWVANATMPTVVNQQYVSINTPYGLRSAQNPLYSYSFHPQPSASEFPPSDGQITKYNHTVRYPNSQGQSQPDLANQQLQRNSYALTALTYQLIADPEAYAPWSNTAYTDSRGNHYNSIENMHNAIHGLVGYGGHMSDIPYSSFDPIFFLHHANVDRLFAMYQAIYPNNYTVPQVNAYGTFTNAPGSTEDINSPLTPFHNNVAGTSLHTSASVRKTLTFGYTYTEIVDWGVSASQLATNVRAALNKLYNPTGSIATKRDLLEKPSMLSRFGLGRRQFRNDNDYQYVVNIQVQKNALQAAFFIHFFLGPPEGIIANNLGLASNLIGSQCILYYDSPAADADPAAASSPAGVTYGQIPLNHALVSPSSSGPIGKLIGGALNSLSPTIVVPILQSLLTWKIQLFDGTVVDPSSKAELKKSLKIFVAARQVSSPSAQQLAQGVLPQWSNWTAYASATAGKAGSGIPSGGKLPDSLF